MKIINFFKKISIGTKIVISLTMVSLIFQIVLAIIGRSVPENGNSNSQPTYKEIINRENASSESDFLYTIDGDSVAIDEYIGRDSDVIIPSVIEGKWVTRINRYAFEFKHHNLVSITIPDSISYIDYYVARLCKNLESIIVDDENPYYSSRDGILFNKDKTELILFPRGKSGDYTIPNSVNKIYNAAFQSCNKVKSVTIPVSVTYIGAYAFAQCYGLSEIILSKNIEFIGRRAFWLYENTNFKSIRVDDENPYYSSRDGVLFNKDMTNLISFPQGKKGKYTIPESVNKISESAFGGCTGLTEIIIPKSITEIGDYTFEGCSALSTVSIPDSIAKIGEAAFRHCPDLTVISIPDSVIHIGADAFSSCNRLKEIILPDNIISIGTGVFMGCDNLLSITIPDGWAYIPEGMFSACFKLETVNLPESIIRIESQAFSSCNNLITIIIPENVRYIDESAFSYCYRLTAFVMPNKPNMNSIGKRAFEQCKNLNFIEIPYNVDYIGDEAFAYCDGLNGISLPCNLRRIEGKTFYQCINLKTIDIPGSVTYISKDAFLMCSSLTSIYVNDGSEDYSSQDGVLFNKDKTELILCPPGKSGKYIIPDSVVHIGESAFYGCSSMTEIIVPDSVMSFGEDAFLMCGATVVISDRIIE